MRLGVWLAMVAVGSVSCEGVAPPAPADRGGPEPAAGDRPLRAALTLQADGDLILGVQTDLVVTGALPGELVRLALSRRGEGAGPCPQLMGGQCLDILPPLFSFSDAADAGGVARFPVRPDARFGPALSGQAVVIRGPGGRDTVKSPARTWTILAEGCGDGIRNGDEQCDGADLGPASCNGTVACTDQCTVDWSGCQGHALDFDGNDDRVEVAGFALGAPAATWEVELHRRNLGIGTVLDFGLAGQAGRRFGLEVEDAGLRCTLDGGASGVARLDQGLLSDGSHVACVWDGATLEVWVDGVAGVADPGAWSGDLTVSPTDAHLVGTDGTNAFDGLVDEVRIWSVARTPAELEATRGTLLVGDEPGLEGYWRFDEGAGQLVADVTGHGADGWLGPTGGTDAADPSWVPDGAPPWPASEVSCFLPIAVASCVLPADPDANPGPTPLVSTDPAPVVGWGLPGTTPSSAALLAQLADPCGIGPVRLQDTEFLTNGVTSAVVIGFADVINGIDAGARAWPLLELPAGPPMPRQPPDAFPYPGASLITSERWGYTVQGVVPVVDLGGSPGDCTGIGTFTGSAPVVGFTVAYVFDARSDGGGRGLMLQLDLLTHYHLGQVPDPAALGNVFP